MAAAGVLPVEPASVKTKQYEAAKTAGGLICFSDYNRDVAYWLKATSRACHKEKRPREFEQVSALGRRRDFQVGILFSSRYHKMGVWRIAGPGHRGGYIMKYLVGAIVLSFVASPASAQKMNADDLKWVNECIEDSRGEPGATPAIARAYCICMNEKMDDHETRSITQWEKTHPVERRACDKQAGWH